MSFATTLLDACCPRSRETVMRSGVSVRIDDRQACDVYPGFCEIHVSIQDPDGSSVFLELSPAPHNTEVCEVVERHGGQVIHAPLGASVRLSVGPKDARHVRDLARAIRRIIGRGQRYPDPNWKWICPRTANSLERFARLLARANRQPAN